MYHHRAFLFFLSQLHPMDVMVCEIQTGFLCSPKHTGKGDYFTAPQFMYPSFKLPVQGNLNISALIMRLGL